MVAAFPAAKLGALIIKQVSKPLANVIKARAKTSPFFRTYICMPPAQFYHWAEVKLKMWTMNLGRPVSIPKLNENMAIDLGAELVGEGIIFAIAAGIVIIEYTRSSRKEAAKEEQRVQELIRIQEELKELYFAKARQEAQIRELVRILHVNIPTASYSPNPYDVNAIPLHHREAPKEEEGTSIWQSVNNLIWTAVDIVLPPNPDEVQRPSVIKVVETPARTQTSQPNSPSSSTPPTPASSEPPAPPASKKEPEKKV